MKKQLDKTSIKILELLTKNAKITNSDIAKEIGLVPSAVLERVRKLEKNGVINGYTALLNKEVFKLNLLAFVHIAVDVPNWDDEIAKNLVKVPWVQEIHEITGEESYLLKICTQGPVHLSNVLKNYIAKVKGVKYTKTTIVLKSLKETTNFPLEIPPIKK
ncbi:Lrp/AsnC family transcriptional regulator [Candidatus Marinamargulisbacteria bacterium SCGC AAA071-K20]|nr:Lrp/AsnC family transcriptional regulator [Candidatus Marinamargulisbacteria bacterium SCGC AAA071-K20]